MFMKNKILYCVLVFFIVENTFAQSSKGLEYLREDFSISFPPQGWTIDAQAANWSSKTTANAGGNAPEARLAWSPQFNSTTRLISPQIDLTGVSNVRFEFKHSIDNYSGGYTVGIATRSGTGNWNIAWSKAGQNITESVNIPINTPDVGASDFQICIYFSGDSYSFNYWYIDDLLLYKPFNLDGMVKSIDIYPYQAQGNKDIKASFANIGSSVVNSFDINYQIDNGTIYTEKFSNLLIATGTSYQVTFGNIWNATPGNYDLKVWIENVNSVVDEDITNNSLDKNISIASQTVSNLPMFEEFTSSTCNPCGTFNSNVLTPFFNSHINQFAIVKYQMSWPAPGDPYYNEDGGIRRTYYGVNSVPYLYIGGNNYATSSSGVSSGFISETSKDAFFTISASHFITNQSIHVLVNIMPYISTDELTVHTVVVEKETLNNIGNNGETSFHYVMMKMIPDANGNNVNFEAGQSKQLSYSANLLATNIEEYNDLAVIVFIQNNENKEIFQSSFSLKEFGYSSNIVDGQVNVDRNSNLIISFSDPIRKIDDSELTNDDLANIISMSSAKTDIPFTATINSEKNEITVTPNTILPPDELIYISFTPDVVENGNNTIFGGFSFSFTTATEISVGSINLSKINIYSSNDITRIKNASGTTIQLYNCLGILILSQFVDSNDYEIKTGKLPTGTYIIKINSKEKTETIKFPILH